MHGLRLASKRSGIIHPRLPRGNCHYWACLGPKRTNPLHNQHPYGECGPTHQRRGAAGHGPQICFAPTVPRQPFFRLLLGDPKQSPGGVADGQRAHRTLLLKAPIGLRAPTTWYMPHEIPEVFHMLLRHGRGFGLSDLEETAKVAGHRPLGGSWFRPEKVQASSSFACQRAVHRCQRARKSGPRSV